MIVRYCCSELKSALADGTLEFDDTMDGMHSGTMKVQILFCPFCGDRTNIGMMEGRR